VLRELQVPIWVAAAEPNTSRELLEALDEKLDVPLSGKRVAVQEYGASNRELLTGLEERGAVVTRVPVYRWALPEDIGPLQSAIGSIARAEIDVALFTTATQVVHLLEVAGTMGLEEAVRDGLARGVVASIGPTTSDGLREHGIEADMEPSHPKMGLLVREAAERSASLLQGKR
jgi:uroporphyrinogen-III synthase